MGRPRFEQARCIAKGMFEIGNQSGIPKRSIALECRALAWAAFRRIARLHGFSHLVDALHLAEDAYALLREDPTAEVEPRGKLGEEL